MPKYELKQYKTAINKLKFIDGWFWCRYTLNPYGGCEHACIYCDARSQKYYMHNDFEETIFVKENIEKILDKQLKSSQKDVIAMAGVCDAYQQAEKIYKNTRKCLRVIEGYGFPVNISTKSDLIVRDLDLFKSIAKKSWCSIAFTITSLDENIENFLEPGAPPSYKRLNAISKIKEHNSKIQVGVNFMPIVPFLEDSNENLEKVIRESKEHGADYIHFAPGMTLRDNQRIFFLKKIKISYPELVSKFKNLYKQKIQADFQYIKQKNSIIAKLCEKYDMKMRQKRWIPTDYRKLNYIIAEILLNESYFNQIIGKPFSKLQWAALSITNLKKSIIEYHNQNKLHEIENVTPWIAQKIIELLPSKQKGTLEDFF